VKIVEDLSDQDRSRFQLTGRSDHLPPSLVVKPQDLEPAIGHLLSQAKVGQVEGFRETLYPSSSRFVLKGSFGLEVIPTRGFARIVCVL
jgi:hypothetical protein